MVLKGLKVWMTGHRPEDAVDAPEMTVVRACGRVIPVEDSEFSERRKFAVRADRWPPGPSMDNFS
jgi:hypothetical protein